jgi:hypothetical protein
MSVAFLGNLHFKEVYFSPLCMIPRTTDTQWLNPQFFAAQIRIPIPNKYLGSGYKGLVFCKNNG